MSLFSSDGTGKARYLSIGVTRASHDDASFGFERAQKVRLRYAVGAWRAAIWV